MVRLSRLTLGLVVGFVLLILVIRLGIGGTEMSRFSLLFTNPDGSPCQRPCLVGIRIDGMTYYQVWSVLDSHPVLQRQNFGGGISQGYTEDGRITDLDIAYDYGSLRPPLYTFGDVINVLGAPSYVEINLDTGCVELYFDADHLVISNWATALPVCDGSYFDAGDRVRGIELIGPDELLRIQTLKPWHGFGDFHQYALP